MAVTGLATPCLDWHAADLPQALKKFKVCELYFSGPLKSKSEQEKISYLLIWTGDEGIELASTWDLSDEERKKLNTYWTKFEGYVAPKSNFRLARYKLRTLKQAEGETIDSFLKKVLVSESKYSNADEHLIDALIFGSNNPNVQAKLLEQDSTLTLDKAIDIARTQEATSTQLADIRGPSSSIHALEHKNRKKQQQQTLDKSSMKMCGNCGRSHGLSSRSVCPAFNTRCKNCNRLHHWGRVCRSGKQPTLHGKNHGKPQQYPKGKAQKQVNSLEQQRLIMQTQ